MKLGIFTDAHYSSAPLTCGRRYNNQSLRKIKEAYAYFADEGCDLIVFLGDLSDPEDTREQEFGNLGDIAAVMHGTPIPTVCLIGNHDADIYTREEFFGALALPQTKELHMQGRRFLFLDACYFKDGSPYAPGRSDWTDTYFPEEDELRAKLTDTTEDTYLFMHQNIDPAADPVHRVHNADSLFAMINQSGCVKTVFQGHYHLGCRSEYDGIGYITLPAMCENEFAYWVFEI